jgi:hypothetical protein
MPLSTLPDGSELIDPLRHRTPTQSESPAAGRSNHYGADVERSRSQKTDSQTSRHHEIRPHHRKCEANLGLDGEGDGSWLTTLIHQPVRSNSNICGFCGDDARPSETPTITRVAACTLALPPIRDTLSEGFSYFVTSIAAPVASGWSGCRVGFAPTGKRRLVTAHTQRRDRDAPRFNWHREVDHFT